MSISKMNIMVEQSEKYDREEHSIQNGDVSGNEYKKSVVSNINKELMSIMVS